MIRWTGLLCRKRKASQGQKDADRAVKRAQEARREATARRAEVTEATQKLRAIRERNHFAEMFRAAIESGSQ